MELQLQRQQAQAQRQTLDRLARRPPAAAAAAVAAVQPSPAPAQPKPEGPSCGGNSSSGFLLSALTPDDLDSGPGSGSTLETSSAKQDVFLAELLLGALSLQSDDHDDQS